jgi:hypothetical protein
VVGREADTGADPESHDSSAPALDQAADRRATADVARTADAVAADAAITPDALTRRDLAGPRDLAAPPAVDAAPEARPQDPALARGLVLYLPFDDGPGNMARDDSGNGNHALPQSLDASGWAEGRFGRGLLLRGGSAGGWLRVEDAPILTTIGESLTVSAWVRGLPGVDADGLILSRFSAGAHGFLYAFGVTSARIRLQINSSNGYFADVQSAAALPRGPWVHVAATFDQLQVRLYTDGRLAAAAPYLLGIAAGNTPIVIGGGQVESDITARFAGGLDEVMLYNRALAPAEVAALARGARPPTVR